MFEAWAIAATTAAVGAYSASRASKENRKGSEFEAQAGKEGIALSGYEDRKSMQFASDLGYRDLQRERDNKAKAFAGLARNMNPNLPSDYQFQQVDVPNLPSNEIPTSGADIYARQG